MWRFIVVALLALCGYAAYWGMSLPVVYKTPDETPLCATDINGNEIPLESVIGERYNTRFVLECPTNVKHSS